MSFEADTKVTTTQATTNDVGVEQYFSQQVLFRTYVRVWCVNEFLLHSKDTFLIPDPVWVWKNVQWTLFGVALVCPRRWSAAAVTAVRIAAYVVHFPNNWDSNYWSVAVDTLFLATVWLVSDDDNDNHNHNDKYNDNHNHKYNDNPIIRSCQDPIRWCMGILYTGAGWWKLNTSAMDPTTSCSTIYVVSLLSYLPVDVESVPTSVLSVAAAIAPSMTMIGELLLGCFLLAPRSLVGLRRVGVLMGLLLHYFICITPFPNQVSGFGIFCFTRFFFVMPEAWTAAIYETLAINSSSSSLSSLSSSSSSLSDFWSKVGIATFVASSALLTSKPGVIIDWCIPMQTFNAKRTVLRVIQGTIVLIVVAYSFLFQVLGLMDVSAASPFAQMRMHGGSNHWVMPTALLQRIWVNDARSLYGGGVVRVTFSDSEVLNALYPADARDLFRPKVTTLLRRAGHVGYEFLPGVRNFLGPDIRRNLSRWQPPGDSHSHSSSHSSLSSPLTFPSYTIPAAELRRLLALVRSSKPKPFTLTYDRLPGAVGDEVWRKTAVASRVVLHEHGDGTRTCTSANVTGGELGESWVPCADDEIALLPPSNHWLARILIHFPIPVLSDMDGVPCMD